MTLKDIESELEDLSEQTILKDLKPKELQQQIRESEILETLVDVLKGQIRGKSELTGLTILLDALKGSVSIQIQIR